LAEGVWASLEEIASMWKLDKRIEPQEEDHSHAQWLRAVERSRSWANPES
jgi:glycerol kinase